MEHGCVGKRFVFVACWNLNSSPKFNSKWSIRDINIELLNIEKIPQFGKKVENLYLCAVQP